MTLQLGWGVLQVLHMFVLPASILLSLGWSWLKAVPPSLPVSQKGMVSPPHHISAGLFNSAQWLLCLVQENIQLRQVPADLDDQGQPRGFVYMHSYFPSSVLYIGRVTCHTAETHHSNWVEIQVLPTPEEHRIVLEKACQEAERLCELYQIIQQGPQPCLEQNQNGTPVTQETRQS